MNNFMGGYGMGPNGMGMMMPPPFMFDAAQQHMMFGMSGGGPFPPHMQHLQQPPRSQVL